MGWLIDPIPNSPNWHNENHLADSKEDYQWDPGSQRVKINFRSKWFHVTTFTLNSWEQHTQKNLKYELPFDMNGQDPDLKVVVIIFISLLIISLIFFLCHRKALTMLMHLFSLQKWQDSAPLLKQGEVQICVFTNNIFNTDT